MVNLSPSDKSYIKWVCILFHAQTIMYEGVVYRCPEAWREEYKPL